ncbi:MAG: hypothetical protein CSB06_00860 [Bacteroidia bacterium]|nr:MAG: hypothetical protein CSB06_00860 [Bacteroidia bacterium]
MVKAQNKTSYDLRLSFFKTSTSSNKKSFFIESANTVNLFYNETENFEPDAVTGRYYDSAAIVFSDGRSISYTSRDSNNTNNVLFIDNYLHPNEDEFIFKIDSVIYNLSH